MAMNGIDISNWQAGMNVAAVPSDFVIVKATEGTGFTSSTFASQISTAEKAGRLLGVYHYINGAGAQAEMQHFYDVIKPWIGKAIICLDWEKGGNSAWGNLSYLKQCIEAIKKLTGKTVMLYASASVFPYNISDATGCRRWIAQYANTGTTGYQTNPWNEGAYTCDIRQYSGTGRLNGYGSDLDLNKAYISKDEWNKIAGSSSAITGTTTSTANKKKNRRRKMEFIIRPNGENRLDYVDGSDIHPLYHPDELEAIRKAYKTCYGEDIPMFEMGTKTAPWASRLYDALRRKANDRRTDITQSLNKK